MACKTEIKKIDGASYFCSQLPPSQSLALGFRLAPHIIPLMSAGEDNPMAAIGGVLMGLKDGEGLALIKECIEGNVQKDGTLITNIDVAFDNPMTTLKVATFMIKLNFMDFFKGMVSS